MLPKNPLRSRTLLTALFLCAALAGGVIAAAAPKPVSEPKPFALAGAAETSRAVTARIEAEDGGVIEATNAAGDRFRLTIPADALYHDATITLTPLAGAGLEGAEQTFAVKMEPKGLQFFDPATLTIDPAGPMMGEVWWFESLEGRAGALRPGLVAKGGTGLLVWHFSEGAAASGPGLGAAVQARGVSDAPGSSSWLEWQRNVTQQQYEAGKIDKITYDKKIEIIQERLSEQKSQELFKKLSDGYDKAIKTAEDAVPIAEKGDLKDLETLADAIRPLLSAARQCQLLGVQGCSDSSLPFKIMMTFRDAIIRDCGKKGYGADNATTVVMLGLERQAQLFGAEDHDGTGMMNCLLHEWNGTATRDDGTEITVKRLTCDVGIQGLYEYSSKGGVETNFRLDLRPPENGEVQYAVADVTATVQANASCTVTCQQKIAASIGTPERPLIGFFADNQARCTACPTSGPYGAGFLAVNRIELKPGPLCGSSNR
jgi:hypothetical protein